MTFIQLQLHVQIAVIRYDLMICSKIIQLVLSSVLQVSIFESDKNRFTQRARLVLAAKGIEYECVNINLKDKPEWYLEMNPMGKVPTIEMPDGKVIYESAICCGK